MPFYHYISKKHSNRLDYLQFSWTAPCSVAEWMESVLAVPSIGLITWHPSFRLEFIGIFEVLRAAERCPLMNAHSSVLGDHAPTDETSVGRDSSPHRSSEYRMESQSFVYTRPEIEELNRVSDKWSSATVTWPKAQMT